LIDQNSASNSSPGALRLRIAQLVRDSGEGHIPSSFSIVDIIDALYRNVLTFDKQDPDSAERDYFILSKGHGAAALYVVLAKNGLLSENEMNLYGKKHGVLGGHPDVTRVPFIEASTGSLGHGFPTSVGTALGLRIQNLDNKVFALLGDGECHEGTIWEAANIAANLKLGNLIAIVDWNGSAAQLMPLDDLPAKWRAFGWHVIEANGHDPDELDSTFDKLELQMVGSPTVVICHTIKGKGVSFVEGHGPWHHKVPNESEMMQIKTELELL